MSIQKGHIPALDGIRGIAVITVLLHHFIGANARDTRLEEIIIHASEVGWAGVDLFFCLSGFLITGILLQTKNKEDRLKTFYYRRTLRIFPLYYLSLALILIAGPYFFEVSESYQRTIDNQAWFWTYLTNVFLCMPASSGGLNATHYWSLAVEEQFYLVWPFVVYFVRSNRALASICITLSLVALAIRSVSVFQNMDTSIAYTLTISRMDGLLLGSLMALLARSEQGSRWINKYSIKLTLLGIAGFALATVLEGSFRRGPIMMSLGFTSTAIVFSSMIARVALNPTSLENRFFQNPILRYFGKYSYAMYVVHPFVISGIAHYVVQTENGEYFLGLTGIPKMVTLLVLQLIATMVVSKVSWELFEKHFLNLKDKSPFKPKSKEGKSRIQQATP